MSDARGIERPRECGVCLGRCMVRVGRGWDACPACTREAEADWLAHLRRARG
jgi:hypothetical protein